MEMWKKEFKVVVQLGSKSRWTTHSSNSFQKMVSNFFPKLLGC